MVPRRRFLNTLAAAPLGALPGLLWSATARAAKAYEVRHTEAQWKAMLSSEQFAVLRKAGTERPYSSPLDGEKRAGVFACAGCKLPLFSSAAKFDSRTGWPSFWKPMDNAVEKSTDTTLGMTRDEVLCRRCGGHLGHVFDDGPQPTGLRYCINGLALTFTAGAAPAV